MLKRTASVGMGYVSPTGAAINSTARNITNRVHHLNPHHCHCNIPTVSLLLLSPMPWQHGWIPCLYTHIARGPVCSFQHITYRSIGSLLTWCFCLQKHCRDERSRSLQAVSSALFPSPCALHFSFSSSPCGTLSGSLASESQSRWLGTL